MHSGFRFEVSARPYPQSHKFGLAALCKNAQVVHYQLEQPVSRLFPPSPFIKLFEWGRSEGEGQKGGRGATLEAPIWDCLSGSSSSPEKKSYIHLMNQYKHLIHPFRCPVDLIVDSVRVFRGREQDMRRIRRQAVASGRRERAGYMQCCQIHSRQGKMLDEISM